MLSFIWGIIKFLLLAFLALSVVVAIGTGIFYGVSFLILAFNTRKRKKRREQYETGLSAVAKEKFGNNKLSIYRKDDGSLLAVRYSTWGRKDTDLPDVDVDQWVPEMLDDDTLSPDETLYGVNWSKGYLLELSTVTLSNDVRFVKTPLLDEEGSPVAPGEIRLFRMGGALALFSTRLSRFTLLAGKSVFRFVLPSPPVSFLAIQSSGKVLTSMSEIFSSDVAYLFLQTGDGETQEVVVLQKGETTSMFRIDSMRWDTQFVPKSRTVTHTHRSYGEKRLVKRSAAEQLFDMNPTPSSYKTVQDVYVTHTSEEVYNGTDVTVTLAGFPVVKFEMKYGSDVSTKGAQERTSTFLADLNKSFKHLLEVSPCGWTDVVANAVAKS